MDLHSYNILPTNLCDYLINVYESDKDNRERVDNESKPTFTQLNLNRYHQNIYQKLNILRNLELKNMRLVE